LGALGEGFDGEELARAHRTREERDLRVRLDAVDAGFGGVAQGGFVGHDVDRGAVAGDAEDGFGGAERVAALRGGERARVGRARDEDDVGEAHERLPLDLLRGLLERGWLDVHRWEGRGQVQISGDGGGDH
jgi:hypothetical protein